MNRIVASMLALLIWSPSICARADVLMNVRLEVDDIVTDNPITSIAVGSDFTLKAFVQDARVDPAFPGVFSAFIDVTFDAGLASASGPFTYGSFWDLLDGGTINPGLLAGVGAATQSPINPGPAEQFLFSVTMHADHAGPLVLLPTLSTAPGDDTGLYGLNDTLLPEQLAGFAATVNLVPEPSSAALAVFALGTLSVAALRRFGRRGVRLSRPFATHRT